MTIFESFECCKWFLIATTSVILVVFTHNLLFLPPYPPIFGVYQQRSFAFYVKKYVMRILLKYQKRAPIKDDEADKLQPLSSDPLAFDAVYFNTSSSNGEILVFSMARRKKGLTNTMGFLKLPEFNQKPLVLPIFPDSCLYQTEAEQNTLKNYAVAGIKLTPIEPMKKWQLEYRGKMHLENDLEKIYDVQIDATWTATLPYFNYSTDISAIAMSEAVASEPWSRKYFDDLKSHHQTHFEQYGIVRGTVCIDGRFFQINTCGLRDHTFGWKRDWKHFHRYVIHFFQLENGDAITIGVVSVPVMFSRIVIGFVSNARDKTNAAINTCDIQLYQFGDTPPDQYAFSFWTNDNHYVVEVNTHTKTELYMGEESECRLVEKWCNFKVNGVPGWGAAEWQYRNENGLVRAK